MNLHNNVYCFNGIHKLHLQPLPIPNMSGNATISQKSIQVLQSPFTVAQLEQSCLEIDKREAHERKLSY